MLNSLPVMKVLYILDYGTVGGATHSFLEMVVALKQLGVQPIVCLGKITDITKQLNESGIEYCHAGHRTALEPFQYKGVKWPLRLFKKILRFYVKDCVALHRMDKLDWSSIDLIHTNSARNDIGCYLNKRYGIPHIMHIREFADADFDCIALRPNLIRMYNSYTTRFISISDAVKKHWIQKGIQEDKMLTIYNGIDYSDITKSSDNDKENGKLKMLIAGGVCLPKGQHIAVEAFKLLPEEVRRNLYLDIVGWSAKQYEDNLKLRLKEELYKDHICFKGTVYDLHQQLGNYQIGLMCSRAEGFGRVTAEYMHAKLGVIASDSGANPELIEDGVTGLLFNSGDAESLADCILRLYNDRGLLVRLSRAAFDKARANYTKDLNAKQIYDMYMNVISKRGG